MKKHISFNDQLPPIRILFLQASDIYYAEKVVGTPLEIKNDKKKFDRRFSDLMPLNLDLFYLFEKDKLALQQLDDEFYTYSFINVSFEYSLYLNSDGQRVFEANKADKDMSKTTMDIRKELYLNGFYLNNKRYVRYKRSAGSAKDGNCLFILADLYPLMNKWSKTGLDENIDKKCLDSLTAYEAYKALSLSSLVKTFNLNPYNILFVKDFEHVLKDQEVIKVSYNEKEGLVASKEKCDVKNNIFDGEGLLDVTIFKQNGYERHHKKGMMLLRNRFFKCCAFNTNLQAWFKENKITSIEQLNGITLAKNIKDIVLVASESCLKYLKMTDGGFNIHNIKRWCDAVSDDNQLSRFGVVKTDKETRFFNGDMVETTYQLINTLQLQKNADCRVLLNDYVDYIKKIRNIKETPEYVRLFLNGEVNDISEDEFEDDSEDQNYTDAVFDYSSYLFKSKVCFDLIKTNKNFIKTDVFKNHLFKDVINGFRLKLYDGRILIDGTYATLFGNPIEYLKYIIKKDDKPLFDENNVSSSLGKDEIYCSFFKNDEKLVGSRAPHMTMGNLLYATNKAIPGLDKWFNLTRNIVVVDAINNNIQQRLNGADYDSDSMLVTNNKLIVDTTQKNYDKFLVPVVAFESEDKKLGTFSTDKKENLILNLYEIDKTISNNNVGEIVNLAQKLNSHLWDRLNHDRRFNYEELYNKIAVLAVLAGAEIDSSKRTFPFSTSGVLSKVRNWANDSGYEKKPAFFFYVAGGEKEKPRIGQIDKYVSELSPADRLLTSMDYLWTYANGEITGPDIETISFFSLVNKNIPTKGLSKTNYNQIKKAKAAILKTRLLINEEKYARRDSSSYTVKRMNFNNEIKQCYEDIKTGINDIRKTKVLIKQIEQETTPHSLLYILLYIISIKKDELGYNYEDLFENDGGVPALERTKDKNYQFELFNKYHYKHSAVDKLISGIKALKE